MFKVVAGSLLKGAINGVNDKNFYGVSGRKN